MIRWYAGLSLTIVASNCLMAGSVFSAMEAADLIRWGHDALLLAIVPIVGWATARWWIDRK